MNKKLIGAVLATLAFGSVAITTQVAEACGKDSKTQCDETSTPKEDATESKKGCGGEKSCGSEKSCAGKKTNDKGTGDGQPATGEGKPATGGDKACGGAKGCAGMKTD